MTRDAFNQPITKSERPTHRTMRDALDAAYALSEATFGEPVFVLKRSIGFCVRLARTVDVGPASFAILAQVEAGPSGLHAGWVSEERKRIAAAEHPERARVPAVDPSRSTPEKAPTDAR
jgi:hypothetical protein